MVRVTLPDGTVLRFPDGTSDEEIDRGVKHYLSTQKKPADDKGGILPSLKHGWEAGKAAPPETAGGFVGLAGDIQDALGPLGLQDIDPGRIKMEEWERKLKGIGRKKREEAGPSKAETLPEKIAEGLGQAPATIASMAPFLAAAGPAGPIAAPAIGFGAHAMASAGGEGLEKTLVPGARGAAEGLLFGKLGALTRGIGSPVARSLAHGAGAAGIGGASSLLSGAEGEDAAAHSAVMGILGLHGAGSRRGVKKTEAVAPGAVKPTRRPLTLGKPPQEKLNLPLIEEGTPGLGLYLKEAADYQALKTDRVTMGQIRAEAAGIKPGPDMKIEWTDPKDTAAPALAAQYINSEVRARKKVFEEGMRAAERSGDEVQAAKFQREIDDIVVPAAVALSEAHGYSSNAGRTLRALGTARSKGDAFTEAVLKLTKEGRIPLEISRKLFDEQLSRRQQHDVLRTLNKPKLWDYFYEIWVNGLLSGIKTQAVNTTSNGVMQAISMAERTASVPIDMAISAVRGTGRERFITDMKGDARGTYGGLRAGIGEFTKKIKDPYYKSDIVSAAEKHQKAWGGALGEVIRAPGTFLEATDLFFKALGGQREGFAESYRLGRKKGLKGTELDTYAENIMGNLTDNPKVLKKMHEAGKVLTFTDSPGKFVTALTGLRELRIPVLGFKPLAMVLPFLRTPAKIMRAGYERSPLGIPRLYKMWAQLKAGKITQEAYSMELAKTALGTAVAGVFYSMAQSGDTEITGAGPTDYTEQLNWRQTGKQPYSVRIGDRWLSYARIEPLATTIGLAVDAASAADEETAMDKLGLLLEGVKANLTDKTFLMGLEQAMQAWHSPERFGRAYAKNLLGTMMPYSSLVGSAARAIDPHARYAPLDKLGDVPGVMKARLPGLSKDLPMKHSPLGIPIERPGGWIVPGGDETVIGRMISPVASSPAKSKSIVADEFHELRDYEGIPPMMPKRSKKIRLSGLQGEQIRLTDAEYAVFDEWNAKAEKHLAQIISDPGWKSKPEEIRASVVLRVYRKYRSTANQIINMMVKRRGTVGRR